MMIDDYKISNEKFQKEPVKEILARVPSFGGFTGTPNWVESL